MTEDGVLSWVNVKVSSDLNVSCHASNTNGNVETLYSIKASEFLRSLLLGSCVYVCVSVRILVFLQMCHKCQRVHVKCLRVAYVCVYVCFYVAVCEYSPV